MKTMLDALEELRDRSRLPGQTFHAGAAYDALLRLYADDLIAVARAGEAAVKIDATSSYKSIYSAPTEMAGPIRAALAPLMREASD